MGGKRVSTDVTSEGWFEKKVAGSSAAPYLIPFYSSKLIYIHVHKKFNMHYVNIYVTPQRKT